VSQLFGDNEIHDPFSFEGDLEAAQEDALEEATDSPKVNGQSESAEDELQQRNPFDDVQGGGLFADDNFDTEHVADPESQGYTLLPDEDPVNGRNGTVDRPEERESLAEPSRDGPPASTDRLRTAFSQVQSYPSDAEIGLELVAQEIIESSAPDLPASPTQQNPSGTNWRSSLDAGEEFNFGKLKEDGLFNPPPPTPVPAVDNPVGQESHCIPSGEESGKDDSFNALGLTGSKGFVTEKRLWGLIRR
jgi:hypothetical protein